MLCRTADVRWEIFVRICLELAYLWMELYSHKSKLI